MRHAIDEGVSFELAQLPAVDRRRLLLGAGGSAIALAFMSNRPTRASAVVASATDIAYPFTLGIASGDPLADAVVLWTRLAPEPFAPLGGLPPDRSLEVAWQVASDERFTRVVRQGTAVAHPEYAFSVHVDVHGLRPDTVYHYRFAAGGHHSETGRTRTAPSPHTDNGELTFAFASCNSFGDGWFTATDHLADEDVDVVLFLGDYIYERPILPANSHRKDPPELPPEFGAPTESLSRYRLQYAAHKLEPELRRAHQNAPWIVTWDDHEVVNDTYGYPDDADHRDDLVRRANAYRAYWEHMPLRVAQAPKGWDARMYRRFDFGRLARFSMLDVRQHRSPLLSASAIPDSPERRDPNRTMLGRRQESWFFEGLSSSRARWNLVGQGVLMSMMDSDPTADRLFSPGSWDGYQASQQRVLDAIDRYDADNVVILTGDIHRSSVLNLLADFDRPDSKVIGAEFVATSLTTNGNGTDTAPWLETRFEANPHYLWATLQRGYSRARITRDQLQVDMREVPYVDRRGAPVTTRKSFVVEAGRPGAEEV